MKLIRHIWVILAFLLLYTCAAEAMSPGSALKKLRKKYHKVSSLRADFREVFEWEMTGETSIREGSLLVTDDNRFRIDTPEQLMVSDGGDIYRYNRIKSQVIIESVSEDGDQLLPRKLLLEFADGFSAETITPLSVANRQGYRLDLLPEKPDEMLLSAATLWFTSEDMIVQRLKLVDQNGNSTSYYLSNIQLDKPVDPTETSINIPDDVEIFDLR